MSTADFSTNETASLDKTVDLILEPVDSSWEDLERLYEIKRCATWIKSNDFKIVCLQFPDHLLPDSSKVSLKLQEILGHPVYILGDTTYESCCIDYIAAAHVNADAIIHFGPICFSKTSANISYLNIYEKHAIDLDCFKNEFMKKFQEDEAVVILVDSQYIHLLESLEKRFCDNKNVNLQRIDDPDMSGGETVVFLGTNERKLINIQMSLNVSNLFYFDGNSIKQLQMSPTILKRRNYLREKIKDSKTFGIIIGTLGVKNYLGVIERIKALLSRSSKKYYLINVGKMTVAKLANFPEMDIYVAVTCSMSEIYESREFYTPIAAPADLEMALNNNPDEEIKFSYDYNRVLGENFKIDKLDDIQVEEADVSLLTNRIRSSELLEDLNDLNTIALKNDGILALNSRYGAGYLSQKTWKGLEQKLGEGEVKIATEGQTGIAQKYQNETS